MTADSIACLKVTLDRVRPQVLRRIEVPVSLRLDRLHLALQTAIGWTNSHLWEFRIREICWGPHEQDWGFGEGPTNAAKATLHDALKLTGGKPLKYLYDFGDSWEHTIKVELIAAPTPGETYPRLITAKGACPPEDIGGLWGYGEFLKAIVDPAHERHEELAEWYGRPFDPARVDTEAIAARLTALAKTWSRKTTGGRSKAA